LANLGLVGWFCIVMLRMIIRIFEFVNTFYRFLVNLRVFMQNPSGNTRETVTPETFLPFLFVL